MRIPKRCPVGGSADTVSRHSRGDDSLPTTSGDESVVAGVGELFRRAASPRAGRSVTTGKLHEEIACRCLSAHPSIEIFRPAA